MNKKNKNDCHYRDCAAITDNLSRIKKEFAGILGSCFASPRMTVSVLTLAAVLSFSIITDSRAGDCDHPNCTACNNGYCTSCSEGYIAGPGGCITCEQFWMRGCKTCTSMACTSCIEGMVLNRGFCASPIPNCLSYDWNGCSSCVEGYHPVMGSSCEANDPNCIGSYSSDGGCSKCVDGYSDGPWGCKPCSEIISPDCTKCSGNLCNECTNGKYEQMGQCVDSCNPDWGFIGKEGRCIVASDCGEGYQLKGNVCEKLPENCSEALGNTCSKCNTGYLEKGGDCISATQGCGVGYKDMGGFCNRIQYTPAEAAAILNDDNNSVTITFKK